MAETEGSLNEAHSLTDTSLSEAASWFSFFWGRQKYIKLQMLTKHTCIQYATVEIWK